MSELLLPGPPLWLTRKVAGLATSTALIEGLGVAYVLVRWWFPGWELLDAIWTLPLVVIGRRGLLGRRHQ